MTQKSLLLSCIVTLRTCVLLMAPLAANASDQHSAPVEVKPSVRTLLYGLQASALEGEFKKQPGENFLWAGNGRMVWEFQIDRADTYSFALCYAAQSGAVGREILLETCGQSLRYALEPTKGVFRAKMAYETKSITGSVHLEAGKHTLTLSISNAPSSEPILAFRFLELTPSVASPLIEAEKQEARRSRASTDWLAKAGYGLMFHWTSQCVAPDGTSKPFAQAVADFPLERFVQMVQDAGARYVIFTVGHAEPFCPAPLPSWEKHFPHKTSPRDLVGELAKALNDKHIKLICYFPTHVIGNYPKASSTEFTQTVTEIVKEFGERYGDRVAGYWFDGMYQCFEKYPDFSFRDFFKVCKTGNTNRIIALNSWQYPNLTDWQEYWAGEVTSPVALPQNGTNERGPGQGLRYQALLVMEPFWVRTKVSTAPPSLNPKVLGDYISQCMNNGGAVTINVGIYQDGSVDPRALEVLQSASKRLSTPTQ